MATKKTTTKKAPAKKPSAKAPARKRKTAVAEPAAAAPAEPAVAEAATNAAPATKESKVPARAKLTDAVEILNALSENSLGHLFPEEIELIEEHRCSEENAEYWGLYEQGGEQMLPNLNWSDPKTMLRVGRNRRDMLKLESDLADLLRIQPDAETETFECEYVHMKEVSPSAEELRKNPKLKSTFTEEPCTESGPLATVISTAYGPRPLWRKLQPEVCKWLGLEHYADVCLCAKHADALMSDFKRMVAGELIERGLSKGQRIRALRSQRWGSPLMVTHLLKDATFKAEREHSRARKDNRQKALSKTLRGADVKGGAKNAADALLQKLGRGR